MINREYKKEKLKDIVPYSSNNKKHWANIDEIVKSIQANTYIAPIIVDENNVILAGHGRKLALDKLWIAEAEVLQVSGLSEIQKRDFRIRDNKLTELSDWDFDNLKFELEELQIPDLSGLFKDEKEMEEETPEVKEDDFEVDDQIKTDIVLWDLFEIGEHRLLCGDSTDSDSVAKLMNGEKADMVFTDPPYNVNYEGSNGLKIENDNKSDEDFYQFLYDAFLNYEINLKSGGAIYIAHADLEGLNFRKAFKDVGFKLRSTIIWNKNALVMGRSDYHWKHEPILYGWKGGASHQWNGDRKQTTVWECDKPKKSGEHPTMKPIELVSIAVNNSSKAKDLVLDLFLGSGSTMVAAHQLNRKCYGMELDPKYCQVIIDRMIRLDPELIIKKNWVEYNHATGDYKWL